MKNGKNGIINSQVQIDYCVSCGDVVYCPEYNVNTNEQGECEACSERKDFLKILKEEEQRYGILSELYIEQSYF